jgi:oligopeptide transport system ATP-binding protein
LVPDPDVVLDASHLTKTFHVGRAGFGRARVSAVDDVSLTLHRGESLGTISVAGQDVGSTRGGARRALSRDIQMVFQDPYTSLNPRLTVYDLVSEPLIVHRTERSGVARRERVAELLDLVNLSPDMMSRFPHQFSGGQRQPSTPGYWSATNQSPRSTCRCRRRWSTCCARYSAAWVSAWSSSRTTWASSGTCPTGPR